MLGINPADLTALTPGEVIAAYRARLAYDEARERAAWERARMVAFFTVLPNAKKGALRSPADLFPLTWESKGPGGKAPRKLTDQDLEILKRWDRENEKEKHGL